MTYWSEGFLQNSFLKNIYYGTSHLAFATQLETRLSLVPKVFDFKLMILCIPTGQQKFDVNANEMITYRALKGEETHCNHAYDNRFYYKICERLRWLDCKICYMLFSLHLLEFI